MSFAVRAETPPLREDSAGALRIGELRVLLELVIWAFQDGATPETIVQNDPGNGYTRTLLAFADRKRG